MAYQTILSRRAKRTGYNRNTMRTHSWRAKLHYPWPSASSRGLDYTRLPDVGFIDVALNIKAALQNEQEHIATI